MQILNYTFDKTAKTVTFTDYTTIRLDSIRLITNATDGIIIYNFADSTLKGTVATNVLTLAYDTSAMDNADKLTIVYEDANYDAVGSKTDDANTATNTTPVSGISLLKQISKVFQDVWDSASHVLKVSILPLSYLIDTITSVQSGDGVMVNGVLCPVKIAIANIPASTTDGAVVTAVAGKSLWVLGLVLQTGATATDATLNSKPAGAGTAISPVYQNGANGGAVLPRFPGAWYKSVSGEGLTLTTGIGSTTGVTVVYIEV